MIIKPLQEKELSLERILQAHAAKAYYLSDVNIENCRTPVDCIMGFLYQRNDTINYAYWAITRYSKISFLTAADLADLTQEEARRYSVTERPPFLLYNPVGKLILGPMIFGFTPYSFRMYNLEGLRRLVALQLAIREAGTERDGISGFIKNAGESFNNPYTDEPMEWNSQDGLLVFTARENIGLKKYFKLRL
ncbi:MAG: hypothetical protein JRF02_00240 [Deltaproteobacteria bacterium]|nr:hypothetical protein [Deltaproteobacteria bacterium]